ncbi:hypothetical protein ACFWU5_14910 [Nocardia sp. NPDC058640]|uniref:hypothetical protein n=1 Tax=Nocardia sp. NPDC058640 TaxID=3346571 RepID=UPI0036676A9C
MSVTAKWSDFLRDPNRVVEEMEANGEVILVRRSAPSVRLSSADASAASNDTLSAIMQLLAVTLDDEMLDRMVDRLALVFPWIELLPEASRVEFMGEFLSLARGGLAVGRVDRLATMLEAWKETARAYADPQISVDGSDLHYLETPEPVPAPEAHR